MSSLGTSQAVRLVVAAAIVLVGGFALVRSLDDDASSAAAPSTGTSPSTGHDHTSHDHGVAGTTYSATVACRPQADTHCGSRP